MIRCWCVAWAALLALAPSARAASPDSPFSTERVSFSVHVRGENTDYRVLAVSVLPAARVPFEIVRGGAHAKFEAEAIAGALKKTGRGKWSWTAPDKAGLYPLTIRRSGSDETMRLNVFVLVPLSRARNGFLNGYRIGEYPTTALRGLDIYKPPRGFIEVTRDNLDTEVAPHFTLRQFVCKQSGDFPKYVILRERLLLKLEMLLERVNRAGHRADTFHVMSGFRTPHYNQAIGNVKYSRHIYGGAADVFIDEAPRDEVIDDLNGDGRIDVLDAGVLYDLVDGLYGSEPYEPFVGGLGRYRKTASHGPFIHVDVRGFRARWGD